MIDNFAAWPGLSDSNDPTPAASSSRTQAQVSAAPKAQDQWAIDDFCLAKWENTDNVSENNLFYFTALLIH